MVIWLTTANKSANCKNESDSTAVLRSNKKHLTRGRATATRVSMEADKKYLQKDKNKYILFSMILLEKKCILQIEKGVCEKI